MGTQNPGFRYPQCHGEMGLRKVEQGSSSFFAMFDDFSKWSMPKALQNFLKIIKYGKNLAKNEEEPC